MGQAAAATRTLGTAELSAASGYSAQQIRDLEALGVLSPAQRAANGYRRFGEHHVRDLRAYRDLAAAVGPVRARRTMREIRTLPLDEATALVGSLHGVLDRERTEARAAQHALSMIYGESAAEVEPTEADSMTITELAGALGVRASTLRFWEKAGLITPERVGTRAGSARVYPLAVIREARIAVALRSAGYRVPEVRETLAAVRRLTDFHQPSHTLESRVDSLAIRTLALLRAGAVLAGILTARLEDSSPRG